MKELENCKTIVSQNHYLVRVTDPAPLVVLFGPEGVGKTMSLIRLSWFLSEKGYRVVPDEAFRCDDYYRTVCESFLQILHHDMSAISTVSFFFMLLIKVIDKKGRTICQLIDTPGPCFFESDDRFFLDANRHYCDQLQKNSPVFLGWHSFIDYLKQLPNKRVWSFYAEKDWDNYYAKKNDVEYIKTLASIMVPADQGMDCVNSMVLQPRYRDYELSRKYVERIKRFAERKSPKDKSIFVFNKVDKIVPFFTKDSKVLFREFRRNYPNVLSPFINVSPLGWFKGYKCRFAPFSSGNFQKTEKGEFFFHPGDDAYPKLLWKTICKSI